MEICRQVPVIKLRFYQKSSFHPVKIRCNLSRNPRSSELSDCKLFVLGMGFVGKNFAADLKTKGWEVSGTCTSAAKKDKLEEMGYQAYIFDANNQHYPVRPTNDRARARLNAEEEWLSLGRNIGISAQAFRLGGIYGPGRSAIDTIMKQDPLSKTQKTRGRKNYTSRVHVADICQALNASTLNPSHGRIYNIVDDDPAPRTEVFMFAQNLVEEKFPGHVKEYLSLVKEKEPFGEKRVSNARMKKELGVTLLHPTYRTGLRSIIEQMDC